MNTVLKLFLSMSFSGGLIILVLLLGKRFLKDRISRQWQYYIWLAAVLRLLIPFGPEVNLMGRAYQAVYQAIDRAIAQTVSWPQRESTLYVPEGAPDSAIGDSDPAIGGIDSATGAPIPAIDGIDSATGDSDPAIDSPVSAIDFGQSEEERGDIFAEPDDEILDTPYLSVENRRQEDGTLECVARFTLRPPVKPGTYKLFIRATDGNWGNIRGSISIGYAAEATRL